VVTCGDFTANGQPPELMPVPYFPDYYAGIDGSIWSHKKLSPNSKAAIWCKKTLRPDKDGYLRTSMYKDKVEKTILVSRAVALAWLGLPTDPKKVEVLHKDHNNQNNKPDNLKFGTRLENEQEKTAAGRRPFGEQAVRSILTEMQVRVFMRLFQEGLSYIEVAKMFGYNKSTIGNLKNERTWKHITTHPKYKGNK